MRVSCALRFTAFLLSILGSECVWAALPGSVSEALAEANIPESAVAVVVQAVTETEPLVSHQADLAMNPASVMKLLTTYAALEILGPAYTWKTEAFSDGRIEGGLLRGNLYIRGSGNPKLTIEHLWLFLKRLRATGIKVITGDLVLDVSHFGPIAHDPGGFDDEPLRAYNVGPSALLVNYNAININLSADPIGKKVIAWAEPNFNALKVINRLVLDDGPCGDWKDRIEIKTEDDARARQVKLSGEFSIHCGEKSYALSLFSHEEFIRGLFIDLWQEMGGKLRGRVRSGKTPADVMIVSRLESPSLSEVVRDVNKWSNNVMARQLYLSLGVETAGSPAASEKSFGAINEWLSGKGLNFPELVLENGSGLSRLERISAAHMASLLLAAWKSPMMPEFIASLPIVAIDGTMKTRLKENGAAGHAHIKTGTLDGVRAMAGYVLDKNSRLLVLTLFINHPLAGMASPVEDALLTWIYEAGNGSLPGWNSGIP